MATTKRQFDLFEAGKMTLNQAAFMLSEDLTQEELHEASRRVSAAVQAVRGRAPGGGPTAFRATATESLILMLAELVKAAMSKEELAKHKNSANESVT
jgi:hypothetical protein